MEKLSRISCLIIIIFIITINSKIFSQINIGGIPHTFLPNCSPSIKNKIIPITNMPPVDTSLLLFQDSLQLADTTIKEKTFSFGYSMPVNLGLNNSGLWDTLDDGSLIWRLKIKSIGAYDILLVFNQFWLPQGAILYIYNEDKSAWIGGFTEQNNKPYNRFSAGPIQGETIILEYYEPSNVIQHGNINVSGVVHVYKNLFHKSHPITGFGSSGACNINVRCPEGNGWCNQRRSVAYILRLNTNGHHVTLCSGALVNNLRSDLRPYLLTANHCVTSSSAGNISDWLFIFNYQSPICANPIDQPTTTYSISGSLLRASRSGSDFALLELSASPPGDFNTYYAGWYKDNARPENGVGIHHPSGDIKKISVYDKKPRRRKFLGAKCWKFKWASGTTEGGSSGSPLFNQFNLIVGQLYGGGASCDNQNDKDNYGRFDISWDEGGSASTRLKDWLAPITLSFTGLGGRDPCRISYNFNNANDLHTSASVVSFSAPPLPGQRTYNGVYEATTSIVASNCTVQSGTSVTFNAPFVRLTNGFHAIAGTGSFFRITGQGCLRGCNTGVGRYMPYEEEPVVIFNLNDSIIKYNELNNKALSNILSQENFYLYPNPTNGIFNLEVSLNNKESIKIVISDILGNEIYAVSEGAILQKNYQINLSSYPNGIYIVRLITNDEVINKKIILSK
ncbi:MAG: T9SS type A sorting domain-containing protein [Cytophagales bacterium]|nr:T9SS type A sorting domain-containing protein [Cytophagales bacterium]